MQIKKYKTGYTFEKRERNVYTLKEFFTPCFIQYKQRLFELHNDYVLEHVNENIYQYRGSEMERLLPLLFEYGKMLDRTKNPKQYD